MTNKKDNRLLLSVALLIFLLFTTVWIRSGVTSLGYSIGNLNQQRAEILKDKRALTAERATLVSIERIRNVTDNGLIFPDRAKVAYVGDATDKEVHRAAKIVQFRR